MSEELKQYHRGMMLACLARSGPATAGDLADHVAATAEVEEHPRAVWEGLNPHAVLGHLRTLSGEGLVIQVGTKKNARHGRDEPCWALSEKTRTLPAVPLAPAVKRPPQATVAWSSGIAEVPAPASPYDHLSREQLLALLQVHDNLAAAMARFRGELDTIASSARERLAGMGLEMPR